jgi:hypothetical protein
MQQVYLRQRADECQASAVIQKFGFYNKLDIALFNNCFLSSTLVFSIKHCNRRDENKYPAAANTETLCAILF